MSKDGIVTQIIENLGSNYNNDDDVIENIVDILITKASDFTNRDEKDEKLYPYIVDYGIMAYEQRGDENKTSMSEGGISYSYKTIIDEMKKELISLRLLP